MYIHKDDKETYKNEIATWLVTELLHFILL